MAPITKPARRRDGAKEPPVEVKHQCPGVRISLARVIRHRFMADPRQLLGDRGGRGRGRGRGVAPAGLTGLARLRRVGRATAVEELVEEHAQAVDVTPLVGQVAPAVGLLGAHVGGRAQDGAVVGQVRVEVVAPGQSGDPDSPHYDDLLRRWQRVEYLPMRFGHQDDGWRMP